MTGKGCSKSPETVHYLIGIHIRDLREENDLTQTAVAGLLCVGQRTYADYESGKTRIPVNNLLLLAENYDVSMDYITGAGDERGSYPKPKKKKAK